MKDNIAKLLFLDIDGTLLQSNYKPTIAALPKLITLLQSQHNVFCINSNRAIEDILPIARQFSINGPLVGENGVFIYLQDEKRREYLISDQEQKNLLSALKEIRKETQLFFANTFSKSPFFWEESDTVSLVSKGINTRFPSGTYILFNNKFRTHTMSIHIRKVDNNNLEPALDELLLLVFHLERFVRDNNLSVAVSYSSTFANLLVYPQSVSKRTAVKRLKERLNIEDVAVIGDEKGDCEMAEGLGQFYAVGNAPDEVKGQAVYVSTKNYTDGVYDILQYLF